MSKFERGEIEAALEAGGRFAAPPLAPPDQVALVGRYE